MVSKPNNHLYGQHIFRVWKLADLMFSSSIITQVGYDVTLVKEKKSASSFESMFLIGLLLARANPSVDGVRSKLVKVFRRDYGPAAPSGPPGN